MPPRLDVVNLQLHSDEASLGAHDSIFMLPEALRSTMTFVKYRITLIVTLLVYQIQ